MTSNPNSWQNYSVIIQRLLLFLCLGFIACGGHVDEQSPERNLLPILGSGFNCKIELTNLDQFVIEDAAEDIECITQKIQIYAANTRSSSAELKRESIHYPDIEKFIMKYFPDKQKILTKGTRLVYLLSSLVLNDQSVATGLDYGKIRVEHIETLKAILLSFNKLSSTAYKLYQQWKIGDITTLQFEKVMTPLAEQFSEVLLRTFQKRDQRFRNNAFDLSNLTRFIELEFSQKPEILQHFLQLKPLFWGGIPIAFTPNELESALERLPLFIMFSGKILLEAKDHPLHQHANPQQKYRRYLELFEELQNLYVPNQSQLSLDSVYTLLNEFVPKLQIKKFKSTIQILKEKVIGGNSQSFNFQDVQKLSAIFRDFLERLYFFSFSFDSFDEALQQRYVSEQSLLPFFSKNTLSELIKELSKLVTQFRYFRDDSGIAQYGISKNITSKGLLEMSLVGRLFDYLAPAYGSCTLPPLEPECIINREQLNTILNDFRPVLEHFNLWAVKPDSFARNTLLLADLFQNQSNGNNAINRVEAIEYAVVVLSAIQITDRLMDLLQKTCPLHPLPEDPSKSGFPVDCYREYFWQYFFEDLHLSGYFPELYRYSKSVGPQQTLELLKNIELFARDIPEESRPVPKRDLILIVGAFLNIESTLLRFDINHDNILYKKELETAFQIYKHAVVLLSGGALDDPNSETTKATFFYLLENYRKPTTFALLKYRFSGFVGRVKAGRLSIGTLLAMIVKDDTNSVRISSFQMLEEETHPFIEELQSENFKVDLTWSQVITSFSVNECKNH